MVEGGVGVTVSVTGGGGITKLGRYVGHWSVQKLGVGGMRGGREEGERGRGRGVGMHACTRLSCDFAPR